MTIDCLISTDTPAKPSVRADTAHRLRLLEMSLSMTGWEQLHRPGVDVGPACDRIDAVYQRLLRTLQTEVKP